MSTLFLSLRRVTALGATDIQKFPIDYYEKLLSYQTHLQRPFPKVHTKYDRVQLRLRDTNGEEVLLWEWIR